MTEFRLLMLLLLSRVKALGKVCFSIASSVWEISNLVWACCHLSTSAMMENRATKRLRMQLKSEKNKNRTQHSVTNVFCLIMSIMIYYSITRLHKNMPQQQIMLKWMDEPRIVSIAGVENGKITERLERWWILEASPQSCQWLWQEKKHRGAAHNVTRSDINFAVQEDCRLPSRTRYRREWSLFLPFWASFDNTHIERKC